MAGERLADDARIEARGRLVGLAGPHADRGQAQPDAVDEPAAGVVGEQKLAHRLLRAVGGQRREMEFIADDVGERRAISGAGRGEDQTRPIAVADGADRLEEREHAVEIAAIALLEVELGLGGHDARGMKDDFRAPGDEARGDARCREVVDDDLGRAREGRLRRRNHVGEGEPRDRLAIERTCARAGRSACGRSCRRRR